ncbi:hypothetical protein D3C78_1258500 [compost metagenome]
MRDQVFLLGWHQIGQQDVAVFGRRGHKVLDADDHFTLAVVLQDLVGTADIAMLVDQRITGVAPNKLDRHVQLVFATDAVTFGGHFRAAHDGVGPGKHRNLGLHRVGQHVEPFHAQIEATFAAAGITAVDTDVTGQDR